MSSDLVPEVAVFFANSRTLVGGGSKRRLTSELKILCGGWRVLCGFHLNSMKRQSQYLFDVVADKSNLHLAYSALPVRDESLGCAESGEQSHFTALKRP